MRAVIARIVWLALGVAGVSACSDDVDPTKLAPAALRGALKARTIYPAKREEWRTDITPDVDSTMMPLVFRASGTTVALLQAYPTRISQFELHGHGMLLSARPGRVDSVLNSQVPRDLVAPVELSRATEDGHVDVIDSASSILMRESLGGFVFRRDLPLLRGGTYRLCTVTPATLLHVRALGSTRALEAYTLTAIAAEDSLIGRHRITGETSARLRFGGGDNRHCLLLTSREVLIVSAPDSAKAGVPPRIMRLRRPGDAKPRLIDEAPALSADTTEHPFIVDASIVDGGYVVLVGLENDKQGRLIDYYNEKGEYIQSAMLPFTASAMAGSGPRFVVLHQDAKYRWWMSSWLTPMAAHGATAPPEPPSVTRAPEKQLFEPQRRGATP